MSEEKLYLFKVEAAIVTYVGSTDIQDAEAIAFNEWEDKSIAHLFGGNCASNWSFEPVIVEKIDFLSDLKGYSVDSTDNAFLNTNKFGSKLTFSLEELIDGVVVSTEQIDNKLQELSDIVLKAQEEIKNLKQTKEKLLKKDV